MVIEKALIAAPHGPQLLRTTVELNRAENCAKLVFSTVDVRVPFMILLTNLANFTQSNSHKKAQHATCNIRFSEQRHIQDLQRKGPEIRARITDMRKMLEVKRTYVFNKPMIYKMIATLADFDPDYRALDEIVLDSSAMEASSIANFKDIKKKGKFFTNPAYVDALSQSAGFVMNANDKSNLELEVFVNHGWNSFQLFGDLSPQKNYETHVAMLESSGKMWQGDIFVLDGDKVVALFEGITVSQSLI